MARIRLPSRLRLKSSGRKNRSTVKRPRYVRPSRPPATIFCFRIADEDGERTSVRTSRLGLIIGAQPVRDYSALIVVRGIGQRDRGLGAIGHGVLAFLNVCDNPRPAAKGKTIRAWLDCQRL